MSLADRRAAARREALTGMVLDIAPDVAAVLADAGAELGRAAVAELRELADDAQVLKLSFCAGALLGAGLVLVLAVLLAGSDRAV